MDRYQGPAATRNIAVEWANGCLAAGYCGAAENKVTMANAGAYDPVMPAVRPIIGPRTTNAKAAEATTQRLRSEADMIAEARASVAAGRICSLEAVTAWVDSWDTDQELPPPHAGR